MSTIIEREAIISIEEAARWLKISRARAYLMAATGTLPGAFVIGRSRRVSAKRLAAWIEDQTSAGPRPRDY